MFPTEQRPRRASPRVPSPSEGTSHTSSRPSRPAQACAGTGATGGQTCRLPGPFVPPALRTPGSKLLPLLRPPRSPHGPRRPRSGPPHGSFLAQGGSAPASSLLPLRQVSARTRVRSSPLQTTTVRCRPSQLLLFRSTSRSSVKARLEGPVRPTSPRPRLSSSALSSLA